MRQLSLSRAAAACAAVVIVGVGTATGSAASSRGVSTRCIPCAVGQTLSLYGTSYRVNRVRTASQIGDGSLGGNANGVFVILTLTITDLKTHPALIIADALPILTRSGNLYSASTEVSTFYRNGLGTLERLQARQPKTFIAVYDVPKNALHGAQLEIRDLGTDAMAAINLGT